MKTRIVFVAVMIIFMIAANSIRIPSTLAQDGGDCEADLEQADGLLAEAQDALENDDVNGALIATNAAQSILTRCAAEFNRGLGFDVVAANDDWQPVVKIIDELELVLVPSGCFMMGNDEVENEAPIHEICFESPFWMGRLEMSNAHYGSTAMFANPNQPRDNVSWVDAQAFCEQHGGRLPTEAEWEYAARGPDSNAYPWGDDFESEIVAFRDNANNETVSVGDQPENTSWVGALDMVGNVWEWTSSINQPYPYDSADGREDNNDARSGRIIRGGSYFNDADMLNTTVRQSQPPSFASSTLGFRCAGDYFDFADVCTITPLNGQINIRTGPGTNFDSESVIVANERVEIDGQTTAADGFVWWRLSENRGWVRSDVVETRGQCDVQVIN